ncbi:SRPBCC family protein [Nonomuraea sp. CA-141351]|uniref:SRPBCC family protein n=1 Tax=Nonomuraea sp. CA-141351 TaxID=3239996 RepID=UPI003D8FA3A7
MLKSLLYSGPSLEVLHEQYAKRDGVDAVAPVQAVTQVIIDAAVEEVWRVLSDPTSWPRIDPAVSQVNLPAGVTVDAPFTWTNGKAKIASRFAVVDPRRQLTWTGVSFGAKAVHRHVLSRRQDDSSALTVTESMSGPLLGLFMNSRKLQAAVNRWAEGIRRVAESQASRA